ncbi:antirestriction protein ArdA [Kribbella italica]|uniref:Antirestriction protein n=1 Tax=Kribbella italica TaxID=1540520 RepID=A0A7W9MRA8_9ACTN|nr:antirestriction protein ArdA [Kribbella italica]MBB5833431.1 antirestriction protein [Kribbella italica]
MSDAMVWVGCLACYNGGDLVGEWFDAGDAPTETTGENEFDARVKVPSEHITEAHEELWVMDTDGMPESREMSPDEANRIGAFLNEIESHDRLTTEAVRMYAQWAGVAFVDVDLRRCDDAYRGEWDSEVDFAQDYADDFLDREQPWPLNHIDWDAATEDFMQDYWSGEDPSGMVHIWDAH